ncbi:MAG: phosphatase PAP2 family protein [Sinobacterium sp.]|nr:phosphatase PAP2 family protein [Sinobacterium sp.]
MLLAILSLDKLLYVWINQFQGYRLLTRLFRIISHTGDGTMYVAIGFLLLYIDAPSAKTFLLYCLLAYTLEIPSFILLKKLIKRDRPYVNIKGSTIAIRPADKFSLPSGHAAAAFVFATMISTFYPEFTALAFTWSSLIGLSRVVLGVHYLSDIVAGALLGTGCSIAILAM